LHQDVVALAPDLGLGDAQTVDALADDRHCAVEHVVGHVGGRTEHDEMPPCKIEAVFGFVANRKRRQQRSQRNRDEEISGVR
jgi:hypothetical protein